MRAQGGPEGKHPECQALLAFGDPGIWLLPRGQGLEGAGLRQGRAPKSRMSGTLMWAGSCEHRAQDQMDGEKWIGNAESGLTRSL